MIIYTAGPYRADTLWGVHLNIESAKVYARELWTRGYAVICPHANSAFMDGADTDKMFLEGDLEIIAMCDAIFMLPGWTRSKGALAEHDHAKLLGLTIYYELPEVPHV